jgi:hypothetical protein
MSSSTRLRYRGFAQHIVRALGLGALGILPAAAGTACGSSVVVEGPGDGSGGSAATVTSGNTTAVSSSSGTVPFACEVELQVGEELVYACVPKSSDTCADKADPELLAQLVQPASEQVCMPQGGCCNFSLLAAPCGPDPDVSDACCYYVLGDLQEFCVGRPFVVDGVARTGTLEPREDWSAPLSPSLGPSLVALSDEQQAALRDGWLADALEEHASVGAFARFALQLLQLGAPPDLLHRTQRAMRDEIVHAELCFGLANGYAAEPLGPGALQVAGALAADADLEALVLSILREGCLGETVAAMIASEASERCQDPVVRKVLNKIVRDESDHAELAWRFVAWMLERHPELRTPVARAVDVIAACTEQPPATVAPMSWSAPFGRLQAREKARVTARTVREVFLPCAYALLRASGHEAPAAKVA